MTLTTLAQSKRLADLGMEQTAFPQMVYERRTAAAIGKMLGKVTAGPEYALRYVIGPYVPASGAGWYAAVPPIDGLAFLMEHHDLWVEWADTWVARSSFCRAGTTDPLWITEPYESAGELLDAVLARLEVPDATP